MSKKLIQVVAAVGLVALGAKFASADPQDQGAGFAGTYYASLPERAEIMTLHKDGTAGMTLSDQVTAGAGGFTFSDSLGSWRVSGPRQLSARFLNLNFDVTGPFATFSGIAVVDYALSFSADRDTFTASCNGKIFPSGQDPLDPSSTPFVEFDCAYLNGYLYRRAPAP